MITQSDIEAIKDVVWWLKGYTTREEGTFDGDLDRSHVRALQEGVIILQEVLEEKEGQKNGK